MIDQNNMPELIGAVPFMLSRSLEGLAKATAEEIDEGFAKGETALGKPWKPLAPSTVERKGHSRILIDEGDMRESFGYEVDKAAGVARVGTNDEKAELHEFGTEKIPRRPILAPAYLWAAQNIDEHFTEQLVAELGTVTL